MRLESVQGLKQQLVETVLEPYALAASGQISPRALGPSVSRTTRRIVREGVLAIAAATRNTVPQVQRTIALGVAPYQREYRLAVRVQRRGLMTSELLDHIRRTARKEVDVSFIGRVDKRLPDRTTREPARQRIALPGKVVGRDPSGKPWTQLKIRPLQMGASVGHVDVTAGTIGAFVRRDGATHILSNNHVLANEDRARVGDAIVQPGVFDGGKAPKATVAALTMAVPFRRPAPNEVDAAVAALVPGADADLTLLTGIDRGADRHLVGLGPELLEDGEAVFKVGRTTGATEGRVISFELDNVVVGYETGNLRFDGQVEIEGAGAAAFSDGGDSGSLVVNRGMEAVALLFAGSEIGGANGLGLTFATPIRTVLKACDAELML